MVMSLKVSLPSPSFQTPPWPTENIFIPRLGIAECIAVVEMAMKTDVAAAGLAVRPWLQADGFGSAPVDVDDGVARVRLKGACADYPLVQGGLLIGGDDSLKNKVFGIYAVEAVSPSRKRYHQRRCNPEGLANSFMV